jgi:hypothetical protein
VNGIPYHEAAVAEHGERGMGGGDVHAQIAGELADRKRNETRELDPPLPGQRSAQ